VEAPQSRAVKQGPVGKTRFTRWTVFLGPKKTLRRPKTKAGNESQREGRYPLKCGLVNEEVTQEKLHRGKQRWL